MFKVTYQINGSAEVLGKVFHSYIAARMWYEERSELFSFSYIQEVFH